MLRTYLCVRVWYVYVLCVVCMWCVCMYYVYVVSVCICAICVYVVYVVNMCTCVVCVHVRFVCMYYVYVVCVCAHVMCVCVMCECVWFISSSQIELTQEMSASLKKHWDDRQQVRRSSWSCLREGKGLVRGGLTQKPWRTDRAEHFLHWFLSGGFNFRSNKVHKLPRTEKETWLGQERKSQFLLK